jgi:hypothetical protein
MLPSRESTAKLSRHRALSASDTQKRQVQGAEEAQKLRVAAHEAMATLQHLNSNPLGCKFKQEREREREGGKERETALVIRRLVVWVSLWLQLER